MPHKTPPSILVALFIGLLLVAACRQPVRKDLDYDYQVVQSWQVDEVFGGEFQQFETVPWNAEATQTVRELIKKDELVSQRTVLEIQTGTGLLAIYSSQQGASKVVATDGNPAAVACARYNAASLYQDRIVSVRLGSNDPAQPYAGIKPDESFDRILILADVDLEESDRTARLVALLDGLENHLTRAGSCLICCTQKSTIEELQKLAKNGELPFKLLGDTNLEEASEVLWPGVVVDIRRSNTKNGSPNPK
ncbi:ribosomal protein L11 methyltransferase [Roseimaritima multifibrata]|uniref:Ribosomal protein L11 methyltransferase n=1 Tax=Roseimaritima multifibrata TaxID=1930274 RepID=A0A517MEU8_9BACT|nr:50S ribosomal protein L11 methyltransferase [Roseimaritima multifibrata]QDS93414.1 ribosomal protein L11 methyltransferase [Roseimaritima multifibrata]